MTADLLQKALKKVLEEMQKKALPAQLTPGETDPAPAQTAWGLPDQHRDHGAEHQGVFGGGEEVRHRLRLKKDPHTQPPHYYVFFKAKDKDQLQPAFKEFTAMTLNREKRPTIRERLAQAQEQSKTKHREREKVKTKDREVTR